MNPDEAIKKLTDLKRYAYEPETEQAHDALQLGIEALIFSKNVLKLMPIVFQLPQPGETEE